MRLFYAVMLDEETRRRLHAAAEPLRRCGADAKWVEREHLHVTLFFLGERPASELPALERRLADACAGRPRFVLSFGALGAFPSARDPRILWTAIDSGAETLAALEAALREGPEERPFVPHLTLGRRRGARGLKALREALSSTPPAGVRCEADSVCLVESKLSSSGPSYSVVSRAKLT
jgi:2'-5' RNA ligase